MCTTKSVHRLLAAAGLAAAVTLASGTASAQNTTFTYQGVLENNGTPVDGNTVIDFRLFDAETGGTQVGSTITEIAAIDEGVFSADLDFGVSSFAANQDLWLEIQIGVDVFPRQRLNAAPFALNTRGIRVDSFERVTIGGQNSFENRGILRIDSGHLGLSDFSAVDFFDDGVPVFGMGKNPDNNFYVGNAMEIDIDTGNVGFGTSTPQATLDVDGDARVTNNMSIGSNVDPFISLTVRGGIRARAGGPGLDGFDNQGYSFIKNTGGDNDSGMFSTGDGNVELWTNNVPRLSIGPDGNVGIGVEAGGRKMSVRGPNGFVLVERDNNPAGVILRTFDDDTYTTETSEWRMLSGNDGNFQLQNANNGFTLPFIVTPTDRVGINTSAPAFDLEVNGTAGKPGGGSWSNSSDRRLKKNIAAIDNALDTVLALNGVTYEYKDAEAINELPGERIGFIAQDVEAVIPDWIDEGEDGYKRMTIRGFEALAVEAFRDQQAQIELIEAKIESMESQRSVVGASAWLPLLVGGVAISGIALVRRRVTKA